MPRGLGSHGIFYIIYSHVVSFTAPWLSPTVLSLTVGVAEIVRRQRQMLVGRQLGGTGEGSALKDAHTFGKSAMLGVGGIGRWDKMQVSEA